MRVNLLKRVPKAIIEEKLNNMGLFLYDYDETLPITSQRFSVYDDKGYYYKVYWSAICKNIFPAKFYNSNPYIIQNINRFLEIERNGEYICTSQTYTGNNKPIEIKHISCGKTFTTTLVAMQGKQNSNGSRYYKTCPYCRPFLIESIHACVLKQVFLHEYPDTVVEDPSCINPNTKRKLPTDIVNHKLKIAVEIQSDYHDYEEKKKLDLIKKTFWIEKGYDFYALDIRDYKVLEMVQVFFPTINTIPDYVDYNFSKPSNPKEVQILLNQGLTIREVSERLNIKNYIIHNMVNHGHVVLPEICKRKANKCKSLVRLSKNGEFIKEYSHLNYVSKDGLALGTIQRVLHGEQKFAYDSYWVYGEKYYNGDYVIPKEEPDRNDVPICCIKENKKEFYKNLYEAANALSCHPCEIYRILRGERKSWHGCKFVYS